MGQVGQLRLLCVVEIFQKRTRRGHAHREILDTQSRQCIHPEMPNQNSSAFFVIKDMGIQSVHGDIVSGAQLLDAEAAYQEGLIAYDLPGLILHQLVVQLPQVLHLGQIIVPRGDVRHGYADLGGRIGDAHKEIVPGLLQGLHVQVGARRHNAYHIPLYQPLGKLRILHLLADCHLIASIDQLGQVSFHRMIGDAAHGGALFQSAGLPRQGQLQLL